MAKDPKDMTPEELDEAIANPPEEGLIPSVEVIVPPEKKPDEPKKPSKKEDEKPAPEPEKPEEPAPAEEAEEEEEKPVSRREQLRVTQLLAKMKESQDAKPAAAPAAPADALDLEKQLEADPETIKKLQEDRQRAADAAYQQGMAQANSIRFHTRLEIDAPRIEAKFPVFDKNSDKFNPELANAINTMFLNQAGYDAKTDTATNPDLRYGEYVESIFQLASEVSSSDTEETKKNITKQAAKTGLRPDGSTTKRLNLNKLPEQMTDEELDARIALAVPTK